MGFERRVLNDCNAVAWSFRGLSKESDAWEQSFMKGTEGAYMHVMVV
jgi:hypothetical protein